MQPSNSSSRADQGALAELVITTIAEVTRYPTHILTLEAEFEEDLGIDSVKRAEILAALRTRLALPAIDASALRGMRTIGDVVTALRLVTAVDNPEVGPLSRSQGPRSTAMPPQSVRASVRAFSPPPPAPSVTTPGFSPRPAHPPLPQTAISVRAVSVRPSAQVRPPSGNDVRQLAPTPADLEAVVVDTIATVTRYPRDILLPAADFEEDLGIDSVKRAEILGALRGKLMLPQMDATVFTKIKTIADAVTTLRSMLEKAAPAKAEAPVARTRTEAPTLTNGIPVIARKEEPAPSPPKAFAGRIVLVTGSGHGLGKVIADWFADRGAQVVVNSFHSRDRGEATAAGIQSRGGKAVHLWGSVAQPEQLRKIFAEVDSRFGGLDIYVSNASNGIIGPLAEITAEHWDKAFKTNIIGLHHGALLAAPLMRKRGGGRIVALSSPMAQRCSEHFACIGPVKAAVESLVRYLAVELGRDNIQVNAVSASAVAGELIEQKIPDRERLVPYWESLVAQHRLITPEEVAHMIGYISGEGASMITGTTLVMDGGMALKI